MKKDWNPEILRTYVGTYTQIMKRDWYPETRLKSWNKISLGKTKTLTFVKYYHVAAHPGLAPFFCAENSNNKAITTDLATCLHEHRTQPSSRSLQYNMQPPTCPFVPLWPPPPLSGQTTSQTPLVHPLQLLGDSPPLACHVHCPTMEIVKTSPTLPW